MVFEEMMMTADCTAVDVISLDFKRPFAAVCPQRWVLKLVFLAGF